MSLSLLRSQGIYSSQFPHTSGELRHTPISFKSLHVYAQTRSTLDHGAEPKLRAVAIQADHNDHLNPYPELLSPQNGSLLGFSGFGPCPTGALEFGADILSSLELDYTALFEWQLGNPSLGPTPPPDFFTLNIENTTVEQDQSIVFDDFLSIPDESNPSDTLSPEGSSFKNYSVHASSSSDHVSVSPSSNIDASDRQNDVQNLYSSAPSTPIPPCAKISTHHSSTSIPQTVQIPRAVPLLRCPICAVPFVKNRELEKHRKRAHILYTCTHEGCTRNYPHRKSLREHQQAVHDKVKYTCNQCSHSTAKKTNLKRHIEKMHKQ